MFQAGHFVHLLQVEDALLAEQAELTEKLDAMGCAHGSPRVPRPRPHAASTAAERNGRLPAVSHRL